MRKDAPSSRDILSVPGPGRSDDLEPPDDGPEAEHGRAAVEARRSRDMLLICMATWMGFGLQAAFLGHPRSAALDLLTGTATAGLLAMAWAGEPRRARLAAHLNIGLCIPALVVAAGLTGSSQSTAMWYLAGLPALVGYQLGGRAAVLWGLCCLGGMTAVLCLENAALLVTEYLASPVQRWTSAVVLSSILFVLGLGSRTSAHQLERGLAARNQALRVARDRILLQDRALQQALAEAREQAIRDPLTGVFNRRLFDRALPMEVDRARRDRSAVVLLLVDVDRFKRVNDKWGHPVGDQVLRTVARLLGETFRRTDMVCRLGGDEFAVLLPTASHHTAIEAVNRFQEALSQAAVPGMPEGRRVAASLGFARFEGNPGPDGPTAEGTDGQCLAEGLLRQADAALYEAKRRGGGVVVSAEEVPDSSIDSLTSTEETLLPGGQGDDDHEQDEEQDGVEALR